MNEETSDTTSDVHGKDSLSKDEKADDRNQK